MLALKQPFPKRLYKLLEQNQPFYDFLKREALLPMPAPAAPPPLPCPDNKELLVSVNGQILPRNAAKVSNPKPYFEVTWTLR